MSISFVAAGTFTLVGGTSVTPPLPTHQTDDFLIAFAIRDADAGAGLEWTTATPGWTRLDDFFTSVNRPRRAAIFYKKAASASETDPTLETTDESLGAGTLVLRGQDLTTPWDVTFSAGSHRAEDQNNDTPTNPAITTVTDAALVLLFALGHQFGGTWVEPSGYTLRSSGNGTGGFNVHGVATKEVTSAGAETPGAWQNTGGAASLDSILYTLAVRPATGGPTGPVGTVVTYDVS